MTTSLLGIDFSNPEKVGGYVDSLWERRSREKYPLERQWYQNIAWYMGYQNMIWGATGMYEPPAPTWRVRLVVNLLQGVIRTLTSKLHKKNPQWDVVPATTDAEDIAISDLSKQLLQSEWYRLRMDELSLEATLWMLTTGNAFIKPYWDPDAGEEILISGEEEAEELNIGNTDVDIVSPFQIMDDGSTNLRDSQWILESTLQDVNVLYGKFPKVKGKIKTESRATLSGQLVDFLEHIRTLNKTTNGVTYKSQSGVDQPDKVLVHELYIRPQRHIKDLRKGKFYVIAGGRVLNGNGKGVDFPYRHKQLPYVHMKEIIVPGRFWGTSTLEQLLPLQSDYNKIKSQLVETRNLMSRPKWLVPVGANLAPDALTSAPGEIVYHTPGLKPEMATPTPLPSYIANMLSEHRADIEDVSGQHEVSRAEAPGQVRSGRGIGMLLEQDEARIIPTLNYNLKQMEMVGRLLLSINAQYVKEKRLARIVGSNDELLVFTYIGKQLVGGRSDIPGVDYFDVRIQTLEGMPQSRGAQQELLSNLIQNKVLNPEKDKDLILQLFGIGTVERHVDKSRVHRSRQIIELDQMIQGVPVQVNDWHNHTIHLSVLNDFRNSARWDTLEEPIKELINQHAQAHKEMIAIQSVEPEIMTRKAASLLINSQGVGNEEGQQQLRQEPVGNGNDPQGGQR